MKKWTLLILSVMMLFSLTACSSEQEEQNDTNETSNQITETVDEAQPTLTMEPTKAPTPTEDPYNTVWNDKDFEIYGIFDIEPLDIGEYYYYSIQNDKICSLSVDWNGDFNFDFDLITQDAKALFEKTKKIGGKNGSIFFDPELYDWVFGEEVETFEEAYAGWQEESFYADWCYEYNDILIFVAYSGGIDEEDGPYCGFNIKYYVDGDEE